MTNILATLKDTFNENIRPLVFRGAHFLLVYFESSRFYESTWSYTVVPVLIFLLWLLRRGRLDLLIKRCDQFSTNKTEDRIIARLNQDLLNRCLQLVERTWDRALDDGQQPVIVFCVISSRIGTDIENAIRGVHGNSPVVLVLLHCVLSSLLRGDLSDDEELLDTTLRSRMTGITHFAFSDREGLYECHQNRVGFEKLLNAVSLL